MRQAMSEHIADEALRASLDPSLSDLADHMRNRDENETDP